MQSAAAASEPVWDETDRLLQALRPVHELYRDTRERRELLALLKAIRLAPTLEICEDLLRGEHVPLSKLDPEWAKAYGLR